MDITNIIQLSKKNKLEVNILFFSVLLLPISFFVGPLIIEILVFLICFSFIYNLILEKKKISFNNFEIMLISFFCLIVISSLLSDDKLISLKSSFLSIRFVILIYAIIFIVKKLDYFFKYFFIICFISFILNIFFGFTQFVFGNNFFLNSAIGYGSLNNTDIISGFFGAEKKLGSFLCRLTPIVVGSYLLVSKKEVKKKIINILIFFIPLFFMVFLTSERMSFIYCTFTFLFFIFYAAKINRKIVIFFFLIIALISLLSYIFNINKFKENAGHTYNQIFPRGKLVFFSEQHQTFAITSIELFKSKPILGIGPNNFRRKCNEISVDFITEEYGFDASQIQNCSTHPHNVFFQLLAEIGLIGIFYYIIFNIFLFIETFKFFFKKNYNQISFFFLLPVIYYLNPIFPSGNFFNNWYMCFGILGLPFYLYLTKIKKSV